MSSQLCRITERQVSPSDHANQPPTTIPGDMDAFCTISPGGLFIFRYTGSPKVSGLSGLNISLAHMRVTRFSVSLRLMMLWV